MNAHTLRRRSALGGALAASAVLLAGLVASGPAAAAAQRCHGKAVTVRASSGTVYGTAGADVIALTGRGTVLSGAGNDVVCGSRFADDISTGGGHDVVLAGAGADVVNGGAGRDVIFGEGGADRLTGAAGADSISSGAGPGQVLSDTSDVLGSGSYGVSVLISAGDLQMMAMSGQSLGLVQGSGASPVVWATVRPLMSNSVMWSDQQDQVYMSQSQVMPGARITIMAQTAAGQGGSFAINPDMTFTQTGASSGAVVVANQAFNLLAVGTARSWTANGSQGSGPMNATVVPPFSQATIAAPRSVSVFATSNAWSGTVLGGLPSGTGTASVSPANPTATFVYQNGGFVAGG